MKKLILMIIMLACITGCNKSTTSKNIDITPGFDEETIKTTNIKDFGIIEFHNSDEDVNTSLWNDFVKNKARYEKASITLHRYTTEGDLIIYKLEYDKDGYALIVDNRKDKFASAEDRKITKQKYKYLIPITGKNLLQLNTNSIIEWSFDIEEYTFWFISNQKQILSYPVESQDNYQNFIIIKN